MKITSDVCEGMGLLTELMFCGQTGGFTRITGLAYGWGGGGGLKTGISRYISIMCS